MCILFAPTLSHVLHAVSPHYHKEFRNHGWRYCLPTSDGHLPYFLPRAVSSQSYPKPILPPLLSESDATTAYRSSQQLRFEDFYHLPIGGATYPSNSPTPPPSYRMLMDASPRGRNLHHSTSLPRLYRSPKC